MQDILSLIPQRPPFVMVDELTECREDGAQSTFVVKSENVLCKENVFQPAGLLENIAQTAAARLGAQQINGMKIGVIGAVRNFKIHHLPNAGDKLVTDLKVVYSLMPVVIVSAEVKCGDTLCAETELKIALMD